MALGYARTTGKEGVAVVVPGPGALNATAALGTAYAASIPVLLISGQIENYNLGRNRGALHEVNDQLDVFRPLTKWCHRISSVDEIPKAVQQAMYYLRTGRPRPVELEIPFNLLSSSSEISLPEPKIAPPELLDHDRINEAARLLSYANRPLIWAGGGVISSNSTKELTLLAEHLNAPVTTTDEGKGSINENHPLALGSATDYANSALSQADIVLVIGSRLFPRRNQRSVQPDQTIIQIDIDPDDIGRNYPVQVGIVADARIAINMLLGELPEKTKSQWRINELKEMKTVASLKLEQAAPLQLSIVQSIYDELKDGILVPDVTNIGYWCQMAYPVLKPRTYLSPSYFATLGYAFPAALGVKVGNPDKPVVAICGDGGFLYAATELATAVQEEINVVTLVFNNRALGTCLRIQQSRFQDRILGTHLRNPDFAHLAQSFDALGIKLSHSNELKEALHSALAKNRPAVIEVPVPNMLSPWEI
jgi:acetolactate synthase-1/2/3 large subunit